MKACVIHRYGGIEELKIEEVPDPKPAPDEVLVDVHSASINHLDIWVRKGVRGGELKTPQILGSDASGKDVVLYPGTSCGNCESCIRGEQTECPSFGILGMTRPGTFAQFISVPKSNIFPKPSHMSPEEASAFPLTFLTAWRMLIVKAKILQGETVLIHGVGGGVALAGLILAKALGARVIVTSGSDDKLSRAKGLGADQGINYKTGNVRECRDIDIAFDTVGSATWPLDFECVRKGGRIVLCGVTSGHTAEINLRTLYWKQVSIFGSTMGSLNNFKAMLEFVNTKKLKPVIDSVWPLEEMQSATRKIEEGRQFGKVVIQLKSH